ncbi:MAG: aspartate--ammonia ligase [Oscillospiraceae bacterium]|nr:aspartate--ammonia ligase [Oscillospiraceae bacterium]
MEGLVLPTGYKSALSLRETQKAIKVTKDTLQVSLANALNLDRITAPLIVTSESGINDDLNGVERKVAFDMLNIGGTAEVVQSLAKWKRMALYRYGYEPGEGIYTDMSAIRRDDNCDSTHSIYVDQWDWERVINAEDRNVEFLKDIVRKIVGALADSKDAVNKAFPALTRTMERNVFFITTQELLDMYPTLSAKERENKIVEEHKTVFLMQIGDKLSNGEKHDGRAPDYDDWSLNGDILVWNEVLGSAFELSSMGIRVDSEALLSQLEKADANDRLSFPFHKGIAENTLPLTIGGGIGQSRTCMYMLEKAHIGEVQVSLWPEEMVKVCKENGIELL